MTPDRRFERLPDLLAEMYLGPIPDYRDDVLERVSRTRQRPAWTFPERWLPMELVERRRILAPRLPLRALGLITLIALILLALLAGYAGSQRRLPAPFGIARNGAIVYASGGDIFVRDSPTASARVLIGGPARDEAPTFSRQGDRFMFFRVVSDTDACECEVWLANADGSNSHKLAGPLHNPISWDWSPDGRQLLIGYAPANGDRKMTVVQTDGGPARALDVGMLVVDPFWRPPDGQWITFRGGDPNGDGNMYLVHPDGSGLRQLALPKPGIAPNDDFNHGYSWSADGRRLAYEVVDRLDLTKVGVDAGLRIHIADVDASGSIMADRRLEFDPTADNELQPAWLPSGDRLVFQTREGNADSLSVAPVPGGSGTGAGTATRLGGSSTGGDGIGFEIAPDGHSLLVLYRKEQTSWLYDLDTLTVSAADMGPLDVSSYQRLAP